MGGGFGGKRNEKVTAKRKGGNDMLNFNFRKQDKETQRIVVNRCGSYNAAVECVISSDIASRHDTSSLSEKDRTDLIHAGKPFSG
jgi:hypothetical protein